MFDEGFIKRLTNSFDRVLYGLDFTLSISITFIIYIIYEDGILDFQLNGFINAATSLSGSMVAVIITGIAILISLSGSDAVRILKQEGIYREAMFTFEFTAILALAVSVFGVLLQSYSFGVIEIYIFIYSFIYLVLAIATVISRLVTYGDKLTTYILVEELPDDLDEKIADVQGEARADSEPEGSRTSSESEG